MRDMKDVYLSPSEAALVLGIRPATLRDWVRRGVLVRTGPDDKPYRLVDLVLAQSATKPRRGAA